MSINIKVFELWDKDGEVSGSISTTAPKELIQKEWTKFVEEESTEIEDFIGQLIMDFPEFTYERFFFDELIKA